MKRLGYYDQLISILADKTEWETALFVVYVGVSSGTRLSTDF